MFEFGYLMTRSHLYPGTSVCMEMEDREGQKVEVGRKKIFDVKETFDVSFSTGKKQRKFIPTESSFQATKINQAKRICSWAVGWSAH